MKQLVMITTFNNNDIALEAMIKIKAYINDMDLLIIDRGSDDDTGLILKQNGFNVIEFVAEEDYYHALFSGLDYAHDKKYDLLIEFDINNYQNAEDILYMEKVFQNQGKDIIFGNGSNTKYTSFLSIVNRLFKKVKIKNPLTYCKVYSKRVIDFFVNEHPELTPTPDEIIKLIKNDYSFAEVKLKKFTSTQKIKLIKALEWTLSSIFQSCTIRRKDA